MSLSRAHIMSLTFPPVANLESQIPSLATPPVICMHFDAGCKACTNVRTRKCIIQSHASVTNGNM